MAHLFFSKSDFLPDLRDGFVALTKRISNQSLLGITLGKNSISLDKINPRKGSFQIEPITRIDGPLSNQTAASILTAAAENHLTTALIATSYGNCPIRESIDTKYTDCELFHALHERPKTVIKEAYDEGIQYAVLQSKETDNAIIFSISKKEIQLIESLINELSICRIQNGIYVGLYYLSRYNGMPDGILILIDFDSIFILKQTQLQWEMCSFRNYRTESELNETVQEILEEMRKKSEEIFYVNNTDYDLDAFFNTMNAKKMLTNSHRPFLFSACHG